jgi:hypothetical protein
VSTVLLAAVVLSVGLLGAVVMARAPRTALAAWLIALCAVPVWAGVTLVIDWEPHVVATLGLTVSLVLALAAGRGRTAFRLTWADGLMAVFVAVSLVPALVGRAGISEVFQLLAGWTASFLAGRLIGHRIPLTWVYGAVAVAFTGVAALALVEFSTGWNPFVLIPAANDLHGAWAPIQERGGQARAEGAFGHSIALGAGLALAAPLTLAAPFRPVVRLLALAIQLAACVVTFSRIGLATAVLGVALTVLVVRTGLPARLRWMIVGTLAVGAAASASLITSVFAAAGSEAADSADYRVDLLTLLPSVRLFGQASSLQRLPDGEQFFGSFSSVDNALLLLALDYGWVPLALAVLLLLTAVGAVVTRRATPPTLALVAQLPALVSVALITQYATLTWFVAGLAVFSQAAARGTAGDQHPAPPAGGEPENSPEMARRGGHPPHALLR